MFAPFSFLTERQSASLLSSFHRLNVLSTGRLLTERLSSTRSLLWSWTQRTTTQITPSAVSAWQTWASVTCWTDKTVKVLNVCNHICVEVLLSMHIYLNKHTCRRERRTQRGRWLTSSSWVGPTTESPGSHTSSWNWGGASTPSRISSVDRSLFTAGMKRSHSTLGSG